MSGPRKESFPIPHPFRQRGQWIRDRGLRVIGFTLLIALLYFAFRNAPLDDIWTTLRQLKLWQIISILSIDAIIYVLVTARWWLIVQAEAKHIRYLPLIGVRISVFSLSYFTLGPQVGGEPLQVLYLQRKYGLTYTRATASVIMDKLIEFLANFLLLALGLTALAQAGILSGNGNPPLAPATWPQALVSLIGLVVLLTWPFVHIVLLYNRRYPLTILLRALPLVPKEAKVVRFVRASEWMAGRFCRRHAPALMAAIFVSLLAALGMVSEYFLMTSFLGIRLTFWQTTAAWTAGWLSFLVPLPGGLGALEASEVFALGALGIPAASAISVTLLMRGRDFLIGGLGLLLAGHGFRR
jgi:uncharacterized protein (TIRG00374 family)